MSGNIRSVGFGVWEFRIDAGRDPLTGRRRQISRRFKGSKRDAQKALNALATEIDDSRFVGTSTTFAELATRWLDYASNDLSPTTLRRYKNHLSKRILPALGDLPVKKITAHILDRFYFSLSNKVGLKPATVRQVHAVIHRALRQAVLWGWIGINPAANATPPRLVKPDLSPPDSEQVLEIIRKATELDPELGNFFHIAASTGARRGEVCAIRWSNLDAKRGTLTIERSIVDLPGGPVEKDTKTHSKRRLALDPDTFKVFEDQRAIATDRARQVGMKITANAYVFSREPDGLTPWVPGRATKQFQSVRDSLGYDNVRLHDLRHFAATRLMAAGIPVRTVSGRLGHANPATTLSIYTHFVEASDQDAAAVMGKLLSKTKTKPATKKPTKPAGRKSTSD